MRLHDTDRPRTAASIEAVLPDASAFLVRDLTTPLGTIPAAIVRGSDIKELIIEIGEGDDSEEQHQAVAGGFEKEDIDGGKASEV